MLLFADGFENFDKPDFDLKWDTVTTEASPSYDIKKNNERKGERCLSISGTGHYSNTDRLHLFKKVRKSRTLYLGFAYKRVKGSNPIIVFRSQGYNVAFCTISTGQSMSTTFTWHFASGIDSQYIILSNSTTDENKFVYYELGITLNGNAIDLEDCTAWIECRSGIAAVEERISNIKTLEPGTNSERQWSGSYYGSFTTAFFDEVHVSLGAHDRNDMEGYLDDLYICNSEGSYNNTFLGDTRIRPMIPENVGSINQAQMINFEGSRHYGVACDFVNTEDEVPASWDYDTDPDLIEYANPLDLYLRMNTGGNQQLFQLSNPNYAGAEPEVFGVVGHVVARAHEDIGKRARLDLIRRNGTNAVEVAPTPANLTPIGYYDDWQGFTMVLDNDEELIGTQQSTVWTPDAIGADQWGFKLSEWDGDPTEYLPGFIRLYQEHDEILYEYLSLVDFPHRHWDRIVEENITFESYAGNSWAQFAYESLNVGENLSWYRRVHHGVGEVLYFQDEIPWHYIFLKDVLDFQLDSYFCWGGTLNEELPFTDSGYHEWVEELTSELFPTSNKVTSDIIENLIDALNFSEPYIWSNHELLEESFELDESYLWSGHESIIEYMSYSEYDLAGWGHDVEDTINFKEDHFDGWWVELIDDGWQMWFEGITQHWRYEWFMGVIINSIKVLPIEDTGQWGGDGEDGDRTGYVNWYD